jgi:hypothetical protein
MAPDSFARLGAEAIRAEGDESVQEEWRHAGASP